MIVFSLTNGWPHTLHFQCFPSHRCTQSAVHNVVSDQPTLLALPHHTRQFLYRRYFTHTLTHYPTPSPTHKRHKSLTRFKNTSLLTHFPTHTHFHLLTHFQQSHTFTHPPLPPLFHCKFVRTYHPHHILNHYTNAYT